MAGPLRDQEDENAIPHSPRTKGIIQHFEQQMCMPLDGLAEDIHVTDERLGSLETAQIEVGMALQELRTAQATTNTTLGTIMTRLEELSQQLGELQGHTDYGGDTEHDTQARRHRHGRRRGVCNQDDFFLRLNSLYLNSMVHMILMLILRGNLLLIKNLHVMLLLHTIKLTLLLVSLPILLLFGGANIATNIPLKSLPLGML
jgi:hypothetical protein